MCCIVRTMNPDSLYQCGLDCALSKYLSIISINPVHGRLLEIEGQSLMSRMESWHLQDLSSNLTRALPTRNKSLFAVLVTYPSIEGTPIPSVGNEDCSNMTLGYFNLCSHIWNINAAYNVFQSALWRHTDLTILIHSGTSCDGTNWSTVWRIRSDYFIQLWKFKSWLCLIYCL